MKGMIWLGKRRLWFGLAVISITLISMMLIAGFTSNSTNKSSSSDGNSRDSLSGAAIVEEGNQLKILLTEVSDQMKKIEYTTSKGITVRFFVVKGSDGSIKTAFDACDVCGGSFGYHQEGKDIVCNKCGKAFRIDGLGTENKGYGCWPSYLSHRSDSEFVYVDIAELEGGVFRFA